MNIRQVYRDARRMFRQPSIVLMYHRIGSPVADPWQLAVSPENFEQHLQVLQRLKKVVPLSRLVQNVRNKSFRGESIAITFDDGYLDNYLVAKPLLEKYNLPATFFITSSNLGSNVEFWWDELEKIIIEHPVLPRQLSIEIAGTSFSFALGSEALLTDELRHKHSGYVAFEPVSMRSEVYLKLWEQLTPLPAQEQQRVMEQLRSWAGTAAEARREYRCMTADEVAEMSSCSLFSIEGHTETHPALAYHEKDVQRREIRNNKVFLENITGKKVKHFAYPSGNYNDTSVEVLKEEEFEGGFTTNYGYITRQDDPYLLNRLQVNNWDGKAFEWVVSKCLEK